VRACVCVWVGVFVCLCVIRAWCNRRRIVLPSTASCVAWPGRRRDVSHAWRMDNVAPLRLDISAAKTTRPRHTVSSQWYILAVRVVGSFICLFYLFIVNIVH